MWVFPKLKYYYKTLNKKEIFSRNIQFIFDNVSLNLPSSAGNFIKRIYLLLIKRDLVSLSKELCDRTKEEPLLRSLTAKYLSSEYSPNDSSIIDIGSWIGDNSCPWAKATLKKNIKVFAIDPSKKNNSYVRKIASLNDLKNIRVINAMASSKDGEYFTPDYSIDHTSFTKSKSHENTNKIVNSYTLDSIAKNNNIRNICMIHLDVEGLEKDVLLGSKKIIIKDRPLIVFEDHLKDEKIEGIFRIIKDYSYSLFTINEIVTCARPDTRNYVAIPSEKMMPIKRLLNKIDDRLLSFNNYYPISNGNYLIPYEN